MAEIDKIIKKISPYYSKKGVEGPAAQHKLIYNSSSETLEPVYFWILDFMNQLFGGKVEKLMDNFASSPGSGHFSELNSKATQMQQQAMSVLGSVNGILKGVINVIYDLKEWQIILSQYDLANSKDKAKAEAGNLALKQRWMDKVDIGRGQGSLNALASGSLQFITVRDAFMSINSVSDVDKIDLNDRVKNILKPRITEFFEWKKRSEAEMRKRFEIEKAYLKSQVDSLKLYSRWAKPYLKAAEQLTQTGGLGSNPALVNIFNTVILELTLMGVNTLDVKSKAIEDKDLPLSFAKMKLRKYHPIVFIDFNFRGIPNKAGQHYVFGGRAEVTFKAYALNEEELLLLKEKLGESDIEGSLKLVEGMTTDSLDQIKIDIDHFLDDEPKEQKKEAMYNDSNPFGALFGFMKKDEKKPDKKGFDPKKPIRKDKYAESYVRSMAEADAINSCYTVFDIYKKSHGMASLPYVDAAEAIVPRSGAEELFGFGRTD